MFTGSFSRTAFASRPSSSRPCLGPELYQAVGSAATRNPNGKESAVGHSYQAAGPDHPQLLQGGSLNIEKSLQTLYYWLRATSYFTGKSVMVTPTEKGVILQELSSIGGGSDPSYWKGWIHGGKYASCLLKNQYLRGYDDAMADMDKGPDLEDDASDQTWSDNEESQDFYSPNQEKLSLSELREMAQLKEKITQPPEGQPDDAPEEVTAIDRLRLLRAADEFFAVLTSRQTADALVKGHSLEFVTKHLEHRRLNLQRARTTLLNRLDPDVRALFLDPSTDLHKEIEMITGEHGTSRSLTPGHVADTWKENDSLKEVKESSSDNDCESVYIEAALDPRTTTVATVSSAEGNKEVNPPVEDAWVICDCDEGDKASEVQQQ